MDEIKAIPTYYNGTWYKSRLEARWAVFFDLVGIKFKYEEQPYSMGDYYIQYLPDFVLTNVHWRGEHGSHYHGKPGSPVFAEVKGRDYYNDIPERERTKIELFAKEHALIVLGNVPEHAMDIEFNHDGLFNFWLLDGDFFPCFFTKLSNGDIWLSNSQHAEYRDGSVDRALIMAKLAHFPAPEEPKKIRF